MLEDGCESGSHREDAEDVVFESLPSGLGRVCGAYELHCGASLVVRRWQAVHVCPVALRVYCGRFVWELLH